MPTEGNSLDSFVWTLTYADHSANGVNYQSVGFANYATCGITSSGSLKCWGDTSYNGFRDGIQTKAFFTILSCP